MPRLRVSAATVGEISGSILLLALSVYAIVDGNRLLSSGSSASAWTAVYITVAGVILVILVALSLLPFSRRAAGASLIASAEREALETADESGNEPMLDEAVPVGEARRLLGISALLLVAWFFAVQFVGYVLATFIFFLLYGSLVSRRSWLKTILFSVLATAMSAAVFTAVGIRMPMFGAL